MPNSVGHAVRLSKKCGFGHTMRVVANGEGLVGTTCAVQCYSRPNRADLRRCHHYHITRTLPDDRHKQRSSR